MVRSSIHIDDDIKQKLQDHGANISGTANKLLKMFIENKFSYDFGNKGVKANNPNVIEITRKMNFFKKMAQILDNINIELKNTFCVAENKFKTYMEILNRKGLTQDEYQKLKEMMI